ncbi:unnamed protein product [Heligmosomoides polygyrus]|uniref:Ubiquitinyl hydrolase 1 n=1 Tax=Heligmosomoides polygyrus TaxID=6339 RepID=A0A183FML2_HELPZ|nr:unnamed protein product [Heligmosomoides polygyrus]
MVDLLSKGFIEVDPSEPLEPQITNMDHVTLILVNLYGYKNTTERIKGFPFWELGIHHWTKQYNKRLVKNDSLVKVLAYGNEILNMEVNEDNKRMAPYFKFGMFPKVYVHGVDGSGVRIFNRLLL